MTILQKACVNCLETGGMLTCSLCMPTPQDVSSVKQMKFTDMNINKASEKIKRHFQRNASVIELSGHVENMCNALRAIPNRENGAEQEIVQMLRSSILEEIVDII